MFQSVFGYDTGPQISIPIGVLLVFGGFIVDSWTISPLG